MDKLKANAHTRTLLSRYRTNESNNEHTANALLLAKQFGDAAEMCEALRHVADQKRLGYASQEASGFQYRMSQKYYKRLL